MSIGSKANTGHLHANVQTFWNTRQVLDGYRTLDDAHMGLLVDINDDKITEEEFPSSLTSYCWPVMPARDCSSGVFCTILIRDIPYGLCSSPAVNLKKLSQDWVAQQERMEGAGDTMTEAY